jgi:hypothetical protein
MSEKNSTQNAVVITDYVSQYSSAVGAKKVAVRNAVKQASMDALLAGDPDLATAYAKQASDIDAMSTSDSAPAVTRAMLINRRVTELNAALNALTTDTDFDLDAGVGDAWKLDDKRVAVLATVRATTKTATYRGATADFVGSVAHAIGAGDFTVTEFIKAGIAANVTHPNNSAPSGAVGAWMNKQRGETVRLGDVDVTITTNDNGIAILRVA